MQRTASVLGIAILLFVAGCGTDSTLSEDDRAICSDQTDVTADLRAQLADGDTSGAAGAVDQYTAYEPENEDLRAVIHRAWGYVWKLEQGTADIDQAVTELDALQQFCDNNA